MIIQKLKNIMIYIIKGIKDIFPLGNLILAVIGIFIITFLSRCQLKEPISKDVFQESLESKGFEIFDITDEDEYIQDERYLKVLSAEKEDMFIVYSQIDSKRNATVMFEDSMAYLKKIESSTTNHYSYAGADYNQRYSIRTSENFQMIACYDNITLYAFGDPSDETILKDIINDFMPPSVALLTILFILGSTFILFPIGYLLQEHKKYKCCTTLALATVIDYKRVRTHDAYLYRPIVTYHFHDKPIKATSTTGFMTPYPKGKPLEILYNSQNPEEFYFANEKKKIRLKSVAIALILLGLFFMIIAIKTLTG